MPPCFSPIFRTITNFESFLTAKIFPLFFLDFFLLSLASSWFQNSLFFCSTFFLEYQFSGFHNQNGQCASTNVLSFVFLEVFVSLLYWMEDSLLFNLSVFKIWSKFIPGTASKYQAFPWKFKNSLLHIYSQTHRYPVRFHVFTFKIRDFFFQEQLTS